MPRRLMITLVALITVACPAVAQADLGPPPPTDRTSAETVFASSQVFEGGTLRMTAVRGAPGKITIRAAANFTLRQGALIRWTAIACTEVVGVYCNETSRQRQYRLGPGHHRLAWQVTLRHERRLHGMTVMLGDIDRANAEGFASMVLS
jgi:hypothetical protein